MSRTISETKQEEEKLREKAKNLEATIEPRLLQAFKRIRKNSRNGLTLTDDREENMACTKPYVKNAQVVVVKDGTEYTSTADLVGKTVVAEAGSAGETTIQEDENLAQADYVSKSVQTDCLMEVAAGTADAAPSTRCAQAASTTTVRARRWPTS